MQACFNYCWTIQYVVYPIFFNFLNEMGFFFPHEPSAAAYLDFKAFEELINLWSDS